MTELIYYPPTPSRDIGVGLRFSHAVSSNKPNHLRRDTRTTSTPCIELFKPFFGAFARKYLDFKLRRIIIC